MSGALFFAGLSTETNSFSNIPVTAQDFAPDMRRGRDCLYALDGTPLPHTPPLLAFCAAHGLTLVPAFTAGAAPGAPVQHADYVALREEILSALAAASPVSAVVLFLHGAMMSTGCDDCEGDLLARVRAAVGPTVPIGAVLDPHAHLTDAMVDAATILVFMKEYPHVDGLARMEETLAVMTAVLEGAPPPQAAVYDCRLLGFFPTDRSPMREFVDDLQRLEAEPGIVSVSFVHGFPWGDMPETGAKALVYADNAAQAAEVARRIGGRIWAIRDETMPELVALPTVLALAAQARKRPLVVADVADNPGGGAPGDSTVLLRAFLDAGIANAAFGLLYDPEAVRFCHKVGRGGRLDLRLGGKVGRFSSAPVDVDVEVIDVVAGAVMEVAGSGFAMGDTAWVRAAGIDIILASERIQTYAPTAFTHIGLNPAERAVLVVKSSTHFRAFFSGITNEIVLAAAPGAIDFDLRRLPYRHLIRPIYPRVHAPFFHPANAF